MVYADKPHDACDLIAGSERLARDGGLNDRDVGKLVSALFWPVCRGLQHVQTRDNDRLGPS
jgi:hypothetical protein